MKEERRETHRTMPTWAAARWLGGCAAARGVSLCQKGKPTPLRSPVVILSSEQRDDLVLTVCSTRSIDHVVASPPGSEMPRRAWCRTRLVCVG